MENLTKIKENLYYLIKKRAFFEKKVRLSSGRISNYYFDLRRITLSSEGSYLIAELVLDFIRKRKFSTIGGPTLGADPILGAILLLSYFKDLSLKAFIVRKSIKLHGLMRQIEGPILTRNDKILLIDDVATSGSSLVESAKVLRDKNIKVDSAFVILDRQEGAEKNLKRIGIKLYSIFKVKDFK
ncbi:MAG: orotate phosphoribosyltransferase [Candidatus Omnitrophica bacterium]|nr:orotate phosphoribosyltransferase [Candidatus Omnitrophota bacterium]